MTRKGIIKLEDVALEVCFKSPTDRHYYLIPPPSGPTIMGTCKWCGKEQLHHVTEDRAYDLIQRPRGRTPGTENHKWTGFGSLKKEE